MLGVAELPLTISSNKNIFLESSVNIARILLIIAIRPLPILSTRSPPVFLRGFPCDYSIHQEKYLSYPGCIDLGKMYVVYCLPPTDYSFHRQSFLFYGVNITVVNAGVPLNIPSFRNHLFLLQHITNIAVFL